MFHQNYSRRTRSYVIATFISFLQIAGAAADQSVSLEFEGFTEPYRTIKVAFDETGTIDAVLVHEGQFVEAGQPLVRLNSDLHHALLAIAEQHMLAEGKLAAARADAQLRKERLLKLQPLRLEGHARQEEVDRAAAELAMAEGNVVAEQEDLKARRLEYAKIKTQIARRTTHAPVAGVVTNVHKEVGEYVAPNSADVVTLVQIDRLIANFTLMSPDAAKLKLDQQMTLSFPSGAQVPGVVEFVSPVTDAQSGTVLVKLRLDNSAGQLRAGLRCKLRVGG